MDMKKKLYAGAGLVLLLAGGLSAQQQTGWMNAANNADIQYRVQVFERSKACDMEYRDQKQGSGYTTFDINVNYKSTEMTSDNQPKVKTDTEHIVTAPEHTGTARIFQCSTVVEARVSFVQRH
jgi:hypothetical protein